MLNTQFTVFLLFITQGRISGHIYKGCYYGWFCRRTNDESFLSDGKVMEVENDGQKLVVRY